MSILFNGFVLGWSVAWPPGPVNAEMIRRGLLPREQGGGFWETWRVGLGACTGDFVWALAVALGAGALLNQPGVRSILGIISLALLVVLAVIFSRAAWKTARRRKELGRVANSRPGRRSKAVIGSGSSSSCRVRGILDFGSPWWAVSRRSWRRHPSGTP